MNYTEKFHLPQWEKADRILMDDFNQMCLDMESGLDKVDQKASSVTGSALNSAAAAAAQAQATADAALSAANAAQTTANQAFNPSYLPYAAGTYTGNGSTRTIYLGFKPRFAIITRQPATSNEYVSHLAVAGANGTLSKNIQFTDSGLSLTFSGANSYPVVNSTDLVYAYIAFR